MENEYNSAFDGCINCFEDYHAETKRIVITDAPRIVVCQECEGVGWFYVCRGLPQYEGLRKEPCHVCHGAGFWREPTIYLTQQ